MYKILIADDERKLRETMRDYLVSKGFQIVLASDGEAALTATFAHARDKWNRSMQGDKKTAEYSCAVFVGSGRGRRSARRICSRSR